MTNEEAYNKMGEGYAVSHKLFSKNEYLYMDESFIMRDENDEEYEASWDLKLDDPAWKADWYIYKNRKQNMNLKQVSLALASAATLDQTERMIRYLPPHINTEDIDDSIDEGYRIGKSNKNPVPKRKISGKVKGRIFQSAWLINLMIALTMFSENTLSSRLEVVIPIIIGSIFSSLWWIQDFDLKE